MLAASVAPESVITVVPALAVAVPPQVLFRLGGLPSNNPEGRLSVKAIPVSAATVFGLLILKVSETVPLLGTVVAPKDFVMTGGAATVRLVVLLAGPVAPMPPVVEVIEPPPETVLL